MTSDNIRTLDLARLKRDVPALTEPVGGSLVEACMVCLEDQGHASGVHLNITGDFDAIFELTWEGVVSTRMFRAWRDEEVTTENAAYGLAILVIEELTGYTAVERADKGLGVDFWLGQQTYNREGPFENKALLEVSGIRRGNEYRIESRVTQKKQQIKLQNENYPVYVVVVEFSSPKARVVQT